MDLAAAVVADEQSFEVVEPGEGALHDPAGLAEAGAVFGSAAGDLGRDPAAAKVAPILVMVVAAIGGDTLGSPSWAADTSAHGWDPLDERDQLGDVVAVAASERPGERDPVCVDE